MKEARIGNNKYLKEMNQSTVLDLIRTHEGMSRKALADKTGLSATATGAIVKTLLSEEYVREIGEGKSSGGRKPVMLELNPHSYFAIGFDIDVRFIYTVVLDITGSILYENKHENDRDLTPGQAVSAISDAYRKVVDKLKMQPDRILGVGISIPGMIDIITRKILLAPNLGWADTDILESLHESLGVPVYLDNEAMCSALCENWLGSCRGVDDFICVNIESGIGAGMFLRGKMFRGHSGSAGEVGHIPVDENGPKCKCGNVGCLETIASISAMASRYEALHPKSARTAQIQPDHSFDCLVAAAKKGDGSCLTILKESAFSLGKAIGYLINMLNPQKIVLGKKFPQYAELVVDNIRETAEKTALLHPARNCSIMASSFGENSSALGAAIIPVRRLFGR